MGIQINGNTDIISAADGSLTVEGLQASTGNFSALQVNSQNLPNAGPLSNRNKIINGNMAIDQRFGGTAGTFGVGSAYILDRWEGSATITSNMRVQQVTDAPAGFNYSQKIDALTGATIGSTDYFVMMQKIEAYNVFDLEYGTSDAKTTTLSFYIKTSVSGTHSGSFRNADNTRSYPFTYEVAAGEVNTWVKKEVTVPGDTSGTWNSTANGIGIEILFDLGSGSTFRGTAGSWTGNNYVGATGSVSPLATINATWFVTGVQLEVGSVATPFEHRSYGQELALCQRYYEILRAHGSMYWSSGNLCGGGAFMVEKRATPSSVSLKTIKYEYPASSTWGALNIDQYGFTINRSASTSFLLIDATWEANAEL